MKTKEEITLEVIKEFKETHFSIIRYFDDKTIPVENYKEDILRKLTLLRDIILYDTLN